MDRLVDQTKWQLCMGCRDRIVNVCVCLLSFFLFLVIERGSGRVTTESEKNELFAVFG